MGRVHEPGRISRNFLPFPMTVSSRCRPPSVPSMGAPCRVRSARRSTPRCRGAGVRAGETVAVLGAGGVGLHIIEVARAAGAGMFAVDVQPHRLDAALAVGADAAFPAGAEAVAGVRQATGGRGADLVLDTVGHDDSLLAASQLVRTGGQDRAGGYTTRAEEYPRLPTERVALGQLDGDRIALCDARGAAPRVRASSRAGSSGP